MNRVRVMEVEPKNCGRQGCLRMGMFHPIAELKPTRTIGLAIEIMTSLAPVCDRHMFELEADLRGDPDFLRVAAEFLDDAKKHNLIPDHDVALEFRWGVGSFFPGMS